MGAIANNRDHIVVSRMHQRLVCLCRDPRIDLDRDHAPRSEAMRQESSVVAGPGADLTDRHSWYDVQDGQHERDDVGLTC
jgi:hypothetical protein